MDQCFKIGDITIPRESAEEAAAQALLQAAWEADGRVTCLCRPEGVPMAIKKYRHFHIAKLPESGPDHHPSCLSYDPGLPRAGGIQDAIRALPNGSESISVAFRLKAYDRQAHPSHRPAEPAPGDRERAPARRRVGIEDLLQHLWERAGLHRWYRRMHKKRKYDTVTRALVKAAEHIAIHDVPLSEIMFTPEMFDAQHASEIIQRSKATLSKLLERGVDHYRFALIAGTLRSLTPTTAGGALVLKHMPGTVFHLTGGQAAAVETRHPGLAATGAQKDGDRGFVMMTIFQKVDGTYHVDQLGLMRVTRHWIPVTDAFESYLCEELISAGYEFLKFMPLQDDSLAPALEVSDRSWPRAFRIFVERPGKRPDPAAAPRSSSPLTQPVVWRPDPNSLTLAGLGLPAAVHQEVSAA